jgi:hypothetical protein
MVGFLTQSTRVLCDRSSHLELGSSSLRGFFLRRVFLRRIQREDLGFQGIQRAANLRQFLRVQSLVRFQLLLEAQHSICNIRRWNRSRRHSRSWVATDGTASVGWVGNRSPQFQTDPILALAPVRGNVQKGHFEVRTYHGRCEYASGKVSASHNKPRLPASATAWARFATPIFSRISCTLRLTVTSLQNSFSAISLFVAPSAIMRSTLSS